MEGSCSCSWAELQTRGELEAGASWSSAAGSNCASLLQLGNEAQQLEWAKRESERVERERLKRLRQQEQEDLELAIALSKAEMSNA